MSQRWKKMGAQAKVELLHTSSHSKCTSLGWLQDVFLALEELLHLPIGPTVGLWSDVEASTSRNVSNPGFVALGRYRLQTAAVQFA